MNLTNELAGQLIGLSVGAGITALVMGTHKDYWIRRADHLAARSDIALSAPVARRVARFLRNEYLFTIVLMALTSPFVDTLVFAGLQQGGRWVARFPWFLIGLPLYFAFLCFLGSLGPRWKASRGYRVAHLDRVPVRDAFASVELAALIAGPITTAALAGWGLRYMKAATWWPPACAMALVIMYLTMASLAKHLMNRPSSASDWIELGWDDLFRFRNVRSVVIVVAWVPALLIYLADCAMMSLFVQKYTEHGVVGSNVQFWPIAIPAAVSLVLFLVFLQGRHLWRRAWLDRES